MENFYQLYEEVYSGQPLSKQDLDKVEYQLEEIIKRYTEISSPENYITNNLLRASKDPAEIYYCQPYFRELFESITKLHKQQLKTNKYPLICYRGGSASQEEILNYKKNEGQIIQNLGFLSTSLDVKIGEKFANNLMFVIEIQKEERDPELDFGYANIS